jgi:hypothetical protein
MTKLEQRRLRPDYWIEVYRRGSRRGWVRLTPEQKEIRFTFPAKIDLTRIDSGGKMPS